MKYIIISLIALSTQAFADSTTLGQKDEHSGGNCNLERISGCEPCLKACGMNINSVRSAVTDKSTSTKAKASGSKGATRQ